MKKLEILCMSIVFFSSSAGAAALEDLTLGAAQVTLDLSGLGDYSVDTENTIDDYQVTEDLLEHCVSESDVAPYGMEVESFMINDHAGIMARGYADEAETKALYAAAFSPEADSGPVKTFMIVGSDLSLDLTCSILSSLEVAVQ